MTDTLVGRLRNPVDAWVDTKPRDDLDLSAFIEWIKGECGTAAAEIERLRREVENLQRALVFWMPGADLRLDGATFERVEADAGLLAGYSGPTDGPCWGDEMLARALTAESAVAAAYEALKPFAKAFEEPHMEALGLVTITVKKADLRRASAIRAAGSKKTAESGHSPSTHNSASE